MAGIQLLDESLNASNLNDMRDGLLSVDGIDYKDETLLRSIYTLLKDRLTFSIEVNGDINSQGLSMVMTNKTDYPSDGWVSIDGEAYDSHDHLCLFIKDNLGVWSKPDTMYETTPDDGFVNISTIEAYDAEYNFIGADNTILEDKHNVIYYGDRNDVIFISLYKKIGTKDVNIHVLVDLALNSVKTIDMYNTGMDMFGDGVTNYIRLNSIDKLIIIDRELVVTEVVSFNGGIDTGGDNPPGSQPLMNKLSLYNMYIDKINNAPTPYEIDYGVWTSSTEYKLKVGLQEINHSFIPNSNSLVKIGLTIDGIPKPWYLFGNGGELGTWYPGYVGLSNNINARDLYDKYKQLDRYQMHTPIEIADAPTGANNIINLAYALTLSPIFDNENTDLYLGYTYNALNYDYKTLAVLDINGYKTAIPHCTYTSDTSHTFIRDYTYSDNGEVGLRVSIDNNKVRTVHYNKTTLPIYNKEFQLPHKGHNELDITEDNLLIRSFKAHYVEPITYNATKYTIPTNALMPIFVYGNSASTFILTLEGYFYADASGIISATFEKVLNYSYVDTYCIFKTVKNTYIYRYDTHSIKPLHLTSLTIQDIAITSAGEYGLLTDGYLRIYNIDGLLLFQATNVDAICSINNIISYIPISTEVTTVRYYNDGTSNPTSCYLNRGKVTEQGVGGFNSLYTDSSGQNNGDTSYGNGYNRPLRYPTSVQFSGFAGLLPSTTDGINDTYDIWERAGHAITAVRLNGEIYIKNNGPQMLYLEKFIGTNLTSGGSRQFLPNEESCKLI